MSESMVERVAKALWLEDTAEGWDDGSGIEKRMKHSNGMLASVADYSDLARAAIEATAAHLRAEGLPEIAGMIDANLKEPR